MESEVSEWEETWYEVKEEADQSSWRALQVMVRSLEVSRLEVICDLIYILKALSDFFMKKEL